ncbi:MAG: PASTA domain-containing protein [Paludibacteraceae bacterium]|nr:PASTA domain-containing protein [Paludibacteraceae bacterium]
MDKKSFLHGNLMYVVWTGVAALVIVLLLMFGAVSWLNKFTRHGEEIHVPDLIGLYVDEAIVMAQNAGVNIQVIDSTYSKKVPSGAIVEQNPPAASMSKQGRTVYVIINAKAAKRVTLPNLRDMSLRQAEKQLEALGFVLGETEYEPSVYRDLVLDVKRDGVSLEPGTKLNEGAFVTLVVGFGEGTEMMDVPDLTGKSEAQARQILRSSRFIVGGLYYDEQKTEENEEQFIVYGQSATAGTQLLEGSRIDLRLTTSLEKVASSTTVTSEEEDFF